MADFKIYDRTVDVVSAYHWLFTSTRELPTTVACFDRYPKLTHPDGKPATPDFTVLFNDGAGLVAEVANIALHESSVDKLCHQLNRYGSLTHLHDETGRAVPIKNGVLVERLDDQEPGAEQVA